MSLKSFANKSKTLELYCVSGSAPTSSIIMAAKAMGIRIKKVIISNFKKIMRIELHDQHIIPYLVDGEIDVHGSQNILKYLVEKYGKNDSSYPNYPQMWDIDQRLDFEMETLYRSYVDYYYPKLKFKGEPDPTALPNVYEAFNYFNDFLEKNKYAAGDCFTVADFALLATVTAFHIENFSFAKYDNVINWYYNAKSRIPDFNEIYDDIKKFSENFNDNMMWCQENWGILMGDIYFRPKRCG